MGRVTSDIETRICILDFILNAMGHHLKVTQSDPPFEVSLRMLMRE